MFRDKLIFGLVSVFYHENSKTVSLREIKFDFYSIIIMILFDFFGRPSEGPYFFFYLTIVSDYFLISRASARQAIT